MAWRAMILLAAMLSAQDGIPAKKLQAARDLKQRGAATEAVKAYETLLPQVRTTGDAKLLAQVLLETGQSSLAAGDYPRALERGTEAGVQFRGLRDMAGEALAENLAGSAELYRGAYPSALEHYRIALELDRRQRDANGEINRLNNIANVYFFQGSYLDALENYQIALRRAEENPGAAWSAGRRQLELTNLAILYEQLGQNQKALAYYKDALAGESALSPAERGQLLSNAGTLYRRLGDAVKALETYREAQNFLAREHLSDAEIHVLQNVGIALTLDMHDARGAAQAFEEALTKAEATGNRREIVLAHLFRGEASYRAEDWAPAGRDFQTALEGARTIGAHEEQWTALYGIARIQRRGDRGAALATLEQAIAEIESVRSGLGASSLKTDFLANKRDVYDAAIDLLLDAPEPDTARLFRMFEQARSRNLQDAVRGSSGPPTLQAAQMKLAPGSVLLEYWTGAGRIAVLWSTRDRAGVAAGRVDETTVRELAGTLRTGGAAWRTQAEHLSASLLQNVPAAASAHHLLIVPDGVLYLIPFEVLPLASGRLLVEQMPVSYLPSAALLMRAPPSAALLMPWQRQLLALGDPLVDAKGTLSGDEHWARLPEAGRELRAIAGELPGKAGVFAGQEDEKRHLTASPLLHLATHAVADPADANRSRMLFTPEAGLRGSEYLFRGEAQSLALNGTDLVTLSACDTEAGALQRGEGIQSFSRAFLAAGARATVTTLWRVEDGATADFMQIFYRYLAKGDPKAEALRAAKLEFLRQGGSHALPLYWAAFVLNGDGRETIRPVLTWSWLAAGLAAAAAILMACRYLFRRLHLQSLHRRRSHHRFHPTS